jgi:V/A-type H+-transporting ATPase subunit I
LITEGILSPLEIVKTFGNVLSYARLMAVGTASVMLAEVANRMPVILEPLALGVAAALLLHVVNLALGIFGPAIQATRLHFVEFFDKFYESGGRPYAPLHRRIADEGGGSWSGR